MKKFLSGSIIDTISEDEFLHVYLSNPPNKWTKFAFKYFSKSTEPENKWLSRVAQGTLIGLFVLGMLGTILNFSRTFQWCVIIPFGLILISIAVIMFGGMIMNNLRIRKICKKLGISKLEYELLVRYYIR